MSTLLLVAVSRTLPNQIRKYCPLVNILSNYYNMPPLQGLSLFSTLSYKHGVPTGLKTTRAFRMGAAVFISARQVRTGLTQKASLGRWAHRRLTNRAGMTGAVSRWLGSIEGFSEIAQRLPHVQIENNTAIGVIKRYDDQETSLS